MNVIALYNESYNLSLNLDFRSKALGVLLNSFFRTFSSFTFGPMIPDSIILKKQYSVICGAKAATIVVYRSCVNTYPAYADIALKGKE